jgi:hypothetical protein
MMRNLQVDFKKAVICVLNSKTIEEEINAVTILINSYKYLIFDDSL